MKRYYLITLAICLVILAVFASVYHIWNRSTAENTLKVGFLYENDEVTPYTYNFTLAQRALEREFGERVEIFSKTNVLEYETEEPMRDLIRSGCRIIFTNTNSTQVRDLAPEFPDVQFCQISNIEQAEGNTPLNYHTFNARMYEGRYVSGAAAGLKLREMINNGEITPEEAVLGFVGAFPTAEVISSYTAFLLGARSVLPETTMRVRYTNSWNDYNLEKACARALIEAGCVIISQHTGTVGAAIACEDAAASRPVYNVSYNENMIDVAPAASLTGTRANWTPYVIGAVTAVMNNKPIEKSVPGNVHGNDISAGFDHGWVEMLEINNHAAAAGTEESLEKIIDGFKKNEITVFKGNYIGIDPKNSSDTIDLSKGYRENQTSSSPSFRYVLQDVILIDDGPLEKPGRR